MGAFQWDVIARDSQGPGPRSRHGLAFDRDSAATVLFGGIVWQEGPQKSIVRRLADVFFRGNVCDWGGGMDLVQAHDIDFWHPFQRQEDAEAMAARCRA